MVQEIRSLQKLANFFRVSRWGRRGGGGGACTRYFAVHICGVFMPVGEWRQRFVGPCIFRPFEFGARFQLTVCVKSLFSVIEYHKIDLALLYTGTQLGI